MVSVLHDLSLALLASHLVIMDKVHLRAQGSCDDVSLHGELVSVFSGAVQVRRFEERWVVLPRVET